MLIPSESVWSNGWFVGDNAEWDNHHPRGRRIMSDLTRIDLEADFPADLDAELVVDQSPAAEGETTPAVANPAAAVEAGGDAPPVVVIEYRNRGIPPFLMFPLALLVSLAMFTAYHLLIVRPRNQELQLATIRAAAVAAGLPVKVGDNGTDPEAAPGPLAGLPLPLTLESQPLPPGFQLPPPSVKDEPPVAAAPPAESAPKPDPKIGEPLDWNFGGAPEAVAETKPAKPPLAVGFSRPADKPAAPAANAPPEPKLDTEPEPEPDPGAVAEVALAPKPEIVAEPPKAPAAAGPALDEPPLPTREEMLQAIQDEAVAKAAQREHLAKMKEEARARVEAEAQQRIDDERTAFRRALYQVVSAGSPDAGQQIDALCDQFGRNYSDEIRERVTAYLSRVHGRISRESEIRLLRTLGVPEPGILDFLANGVKISVNSRNGPRNPDEVRLMAAKQLLRSRPTTTEVDAARASSAMPRFPGR